MIERYFVTGTDTQVGKTIASIALLQAARLAGFTTAGYKPVASGGRKTFEGLRNSDVLILQSNSSVKLSYEEVNCYTFFESTSPHIASANEKRPISLSVLSVGLHALEEKTDWILVEGAGGWFTPLTEEITFPYWVTEEKLPVILVIGIKIGCINHALLTALAVRQVGLRLVGWIANNVTSPMKKYIEYLETLKKMLSVPLLGEIPLIKDPERCDFLGRYIDLNRLKQS